MVMSMNLGHLAVFHAVAEAKSVSGGAESLLISQPAVSKQVRLLEQSLGTTLFERTPRGVILTEAGAVLAGYARRIFSLEAEAVRALDEIRGLKRGRLAIGASTTIGVYLLPEIFVRFRQQYPEIEASLEVAASRGIEQKLAEGGLDIGFIESSTTDDGLRSEQFMSDELAAIVPLNHPLAAKRTVSAEAFCRQPFVVRATASDTGSSVERTLRERGLNVTPTMSLGSTEAIKRSVSAGIGVAIVSHLSIGMELKARTLAVVRVRGLSISRPLYLLQRRTVGASAAGKALIDLLKSAIAKKNRA